MKGHVDLAAWSFAKPMTVIWNKKEQVYLVFIAVLARDIDQRCCLANQLLLRHLSLLNFVVVVDILFVRHTPFWIHALCIRNWCPLLLASIWLLLEEKWSNWVDVLRVEVFMFEIFQTCVTCCKRSSALRKGSPCGCNRGSPGQGTFTWPRQKHAKSGLNFWTTPKTSST